MAIMCNRCGEIHATNTYSCWGNVVHKIVANRMPRGGCTHDSSTAHICDGYGSPAPSSPSESIQRHKYGPGLRQSARMAGRGTGAARRARRDVRHHLSWCIRYIAWKSQYMHDELMGYIDKLDISDTNHVSPPQKEKKKYHIVGIDWGSGDWSETIFIPIDTGTKLAVPSNTPLTPRSDNNVGKA